MRFYFEKIIYLILALTLILITFFFIHFVLNQVLPYSNRFDDEGYYLRDSITIWSQLKNYGFIKTVTEYIFQNFNFMYFDPGPNTNLNFMAALLMRLFGPGRFSALMINLCALLSVLCLLTIYLKTKIRCVELSMLPIASVLLSLYCFTGPGDMFDFRLDFFASCLYGITVCGMIELINRPQKNVFANFLFLLPILFCGIFRFILLVYLAVPMVFFIFSIFKNKQIRPAYVLKPFSFIGIGLIGITAWGFNFLKNYYWMQQQSSTEKVFRLQYSSELSALGYLFYYPKTFVSIYLGWPLTLIILILILITVAGKNNKSSSSLKSEKNNNNFVIAFLILSILSPTLVLSLNYVRTSQVIGILFFPSVILLVYYLDKFKLTDIGFKIRRNFLVFLCVLGFFVWPIRLFRERGVDLSEISNINVLFEDVFHLSNKISNKNQKPYIAFLDVLPDVDHNTFTIWAAERKNGSWFLPELLISRLPFNMSKEDIINDLNRSYFVVVPLDWSHLAQSKWLILHDVLNYRNSIEAWLKKNMLCFNEFKWKGHVYRSCRRPL